MSEGKPDSKTTGYASISANGAPTPFPRLTRIEIIDQSGRKFVEGYASGARLSLQDEGRTLKVFYHSGETDDAQ